MKKRHKFTLVFVFLCMLLTYLAYYMIQDGSALAVDSKIEKGRVSLPELDAQEFIVKLKGEWKYYDSKRLDEISEASTSTLVVIPENQNTSNNKQFYRYGTYTMEISNLTPNKAYGIYSGSQVTAFNLYANNLLVFSNGRMSDSQNSHVSEWKPKAGTIYSDNEGNIRLAVEISNYEYPDGLFWTPMQIGQPDLIFNDYYNKRVIDIAFLIGFLIIFFLLISFYFMIKYDSSVIYLAILVLIMFARLSVTSSRPIMYIGSGISWDWMVRLEYMSGYMILPVFTLMMLSRTSYLKGKWVQKIVFFLCFFISVFVGLSNHDVYSRFLDVYLWTALIVLFGLIIVSVRNFWKNAFVRNMFFLVSINFSIALIYQISGELISYVPVAIFNAIIAMTAIVLNSFVSKIKENELLAMSAMIDPLTGLYNRLYFDELGKESLNEIVPHKLYVMFLDLDGFKSINDTYGHEEGDYILQTISRRLRQSLRNDDVIIRYGGDEFIILLNLKKEEDIKKAAKRILNQVAIIEESSEKQYALSASIGIAHYDFSTGLTLEDYVRLSDQAMYKVKEQGGGAYIIV